MQNGNASWKLHFTPLDNFLEDIMLFLLFIIVFSYSYLVPTFYILIFHGNKENRDIAMLDIESWQ